MTFEMIKEKLNGKYIDYEIYVRKFISDNNFFYEKNHEGIYLNELISEYYLCRYTRYNLFCKNNHLSNIYSESEWKEIFGNNGKLLVLIIDKKI